MAEILYPVIEMFHSLQGEGWFMGRGATFIRLAGCNLRCSWCDTPQSINKNQGRLMTARDIADEVQSLQSLVVITGGEPTLHNLGPLVQKLHNRGKFVAIETNGTNPVPVEWAIDWITASPKPEANYALNCRADELKYVVDEAFAVSHIQTEAVPEGRIFLQVESAKPESAAKACSLVMENPELKLRLGAQLHKIIGIP